MGRVDKIKLVIYLVFRILLVVVGVLAVFKGDWNHLTLASVTLFLTFLPNIIEREFRIDYPSEFEIVILVFIYASMYLGTMRSFYARFWWWDIMLHSLSGVIIGSIGFSLVYTLNQASVAINLSNVFVAIFSLSFALSIGALWEIYEFFMDSLFGLNMQKSGLVDTMWDLIVNALGALVVSILGYLYLKGEINLFGIIEKRFAGKNSGLFESE